MDDVDGAIVETALDNLGRLARGWAGDGELEGALDGKPQAGPFPGTEAPARGAQRWLALDRSMQRRARRATRLFLAGAGAGAVALTVVAALMVTRGQGAADGNLSFVVTEGAASVGELVHPDQVPARLSFSDGSDVVLHPGARGTVMGTTGRGARIRLEDGRARFTVAHRPGTDWSVEAGPFVVMVHGTVFDVVWSRQTGTLAVELLVGSVSIRGPFSGGSAGGSVTLAAGQRLTARAATGLDRIDRIDGSRGSGPGASTGATDTGAGSVVVAAVAVAGVTVDARDPSGRPTAAAAGPGPGVAPPPDDARGDPDGALGPGGAVHGHRATVAAAGAMAPRRPARLTPAAATITAGWAARVASGAFRSVVDEADATGVDVCLARASADGLAALADAARYVRRTDLARRALLAQRRRFAGSVGAHDAAFLIGRLAEDTSGDLSEALRWYDRYLEHDRRGTYASEALGRKMVALDRLGQTADAQVTAAHYLTDFPAGAFATRARRIQLQSRSGSD